MHLPFIFLLFTIVVVSAAQKYPEINKTQDLETLRNTLTIARDSLQAEITARWHLRQLNIEQRETDKEELLSIQEKAERLYNSVAHVKEECYSKEQIIALEQRKVFEKKDAWNQLVLSMDDMLKKEADIVLETFPTDIEHRQRDLEAIRKNSNKNLSQTLTELVDYRIEYLVRGCSTSITSATILPGQRNSQNVTLARFGNVFGYGVNPESEIFIIRQSGSTGLNRFAVEKIGPSHLKEFLVSEFPKWISQRNVHGTLMFDIMQNSQSSRLIEGKKTDRQDQLKQLLIDGGPVMIPLGLLALWAIVLLFWKMICFSRHYSSDNRIFITVTNYLNNNEIEKAKEFLSNNKSITPKVLKSCLDHSGKSRLSAEQAVKTVLSDEIPKLNSHINTIAVIAGAAPLLGLLGTVTGMINLFKVITSYGTGDPKIMAGGISEALITTEAGLIIAIPVLLIHNFLRNRANDIQASAEKNAIRILNYLWPES